MLEGEQLARTAVMAGQILLENGCQAYQIEKIMTEICAAGGAAVTDSYATPAMIMISFTYKNQMYHDMKRITHRLPNIKAATQVYRVTSLLKEQKISVEDCLQSLALVQKSTQLIQRKTMLGAVIAAFGFAFVFDAGAAGAVIAAVIASLSCIPVLEQCFQRRFTLIFIRSALITITGMGLSTLFSLDAAPIILAALMILVPGMLFTASLGESFMGDILSGQVLLFDAAIQTVAIALGCLCFYMLTGSL